MSPNPLRILAIDPGTRHMGVAVLSGADLAFYGVKTFRRIPSAGELLRATCRTVERLIGDYRPTILAYEKTFYVQAKSSAILHVQEMEIARVGRTSGLRVIGYSPARVRSILCHDGRATKQRVADHLAARFPELVRYRGGSPLREDYWLNMFDAIAVAVVCADEISVDRGGGGKAAA